MAMNRIDGDLILTGRFVPSQLSIPAQTVRDADVAADAAIGAAKLQHQHAAVYAQPSDDEAADDTRVVHAVLASGSIVAFQAGLVAPSTGDATVTVDLLKGGVSVLDAPVVLTASHTARQLVAGIVTTETLAAGDVLEVEVTVDAGTGALGEGVFALATIREGA